MSFMSVNSSLYLTLPYNAKHHSSPLHYLFEWDKSRASMLYNLQQARTIINHVVEIVVINDKPPTQRSFLSVVVEEKGKVYVDLKTAVTVQSYRNQLLEKAITTSKNLHETLQMLNKHS